MFDRNNGQNSIQGICVPDFITLWYCKRKILRVKIGTFGQEEAYSTRTIHIDLAQKIGK